jgi:uncharacterized protein (UPF0261 family)
LSGFQIGYDLVMLKSPLRRKLRDAYYFPGFVPGLLVRGVFGNPLARVVSLVRRQKKQPAESVVIGTGVTTIGSLKWCVTFLVAAWKSTWSWRCAAWTVAGVVT